MEYTLRDSCSVFLCLNCDPINPHAHSFIFSYIRCRSKQETVIYIVKIVGLGSLIVSTFMPNAKNSSTYMEAGEDDVYFTDMSKQLYFSIMDEDADPPLLASCPSHSLQVPPQLYIYILIPVSILFHSYSNLNTPILFRLSQVQQSSIIIFLSLCSYKKQPLRRESKGTGMFIPMSTQPKHSQDTTIISQTPNLYSF